MDDLTELPQEARRTTLQRSEVHDGRDYFFGEDELTTREQMFKELNTSFPSFRGAARAIENIENKLHNEIQEAAERYSPKQPAYDRARLPFQPVDWEQELNESQTAQYAGDHEIHGSGGDQLHWLMETHETDRLESEYPLSFLQPERDRTSRPDAVDDLFVYEFKHLPHHKRERLENGEDMPLGQKDWDDFKQLNDYLKDTDLPVGVLVYVSTKQEHIQQYAVERTQALQASNIHRFSDYDFEANIRNKL